MISDCEIPDNAKFHIEHDRVQDMLFQAVDNWWRHGDAEEFCARILEIAEGVL